MKNQQQLKVGDSAEVIVITNSPYPYVYQDGECGLAINVFLSGNIDAFIGIPNLMDDGGWFVPKGTYKKIGRLTVTKVK